MRIIVVTTWFPSAEHPEQAPFNLKHAEAIALHHDVRVLHVRLGSSLPERVESYGGMRVRRLSLDLRRPWRAFRLIGSIRRAIAGADVLHTMAFSSALVAAVPQLLAPRPWVHTEHWNGVVSPSSVSKLWTRLAWSRHVLARADWLTGVTSQLADVLASFGRHQSTSVVPCVVENPLPVVERAPASGLRLVAVGALVGRKRPLMAVRTVRWLVDHDVDVMMTWVGDGPLREDVLREAETLGVADRFHVTGFVEPDAVFAHYQDADIFFLPTEQENFFTSAAEALSAGRPVVAARVGGFYDYADESNSVLVDVASPEHFGEAILRARSAFADVSARMIAAPIRERFSIARVGSQFDAIYTRLAGHGRRP